MQRQATSGWRFGPGRIALITALAVVAAALAVCLWPPIADTATTTTIVPVADAYVDSSTPTTGYGSSTRLIVDASPTRQTFLRFDLTGVAGPLQSATLRLHVANVSDAASPSGGTVARMGETTWTESNITYNRRPTSWGSTVATIGAVSRNSWVSVNVTAAVTSGGVVTIGLRSTNSDGAYYDSRQSGSFAPQLVLTTGTTVTTTAAPTTTTAAPTTTSPPISTAVAAACAGTLRSANVGTLSDGALTEVSGIEAGVANPNVYWVHNDSGDSARVFAVSLTGATRRIYSLAGATATDWEDIAIGAGPVAGTPYLYLADIGDNAVKRADVVIYRVPEPAVTDGAATTLNGVDALRLRYPDGAHNAEALLADPSTGELYIIEKTASGGSARVYRASANLAAGSTTTMELVGSISLPTGNANLVTGADLSADGRQIAVRTYGGVRLWNRPAGTTVAAALATAPCSGPVPSEVQGEAITFQPDGRGYVTVAEGSGAVLHGFTI